jgi:hypothetical protein
MYGSFACTQSLDASYYILLATGPFTGTLKETSMLDMLTQASERWRVWSSER